jgi:GTP-binding protein Era
MSDEKGAAPDGKIPAAAPAAAAGQATVAGTVAILGRPNVGKSTLLNRIVGEKLAIVSPKPQTTRNRIVGVWNGTIALEAGGQPTKGQMVFVDTPGVHPPRSELSKFMVREAFGAIEGVDAVLVMIEAPEGPAPAHGLPRGATALPETERRIIDRVREAGLPAILAINKVDRLGEKSLLLPVIEAWSQREPFRTVIPISATEGVGVVDLVRELLRLMPEQPPVYDEETITDRSERFLAGELIREQLFLRLRQELPYATAVVIDNWEERQQGDVVIDATILVERDSQKGIIVGKGGQMIRDVGTAAREEIAKLIGRPAHLRLHAKVAPDWTTSPEGIARLGYEPQED